MPLHYIAIDNFRAFKEKCVFDFAPVTILTGTNSSGKSSLVDALRILHSYTNEIPDPDSKKFWDKIINLRDDHFRETRIPNFKDLVNYHTGRDIISFDFKCRFIGMVEDITFCLKFEQKNGTGIHGILKSLEYKSDEGVVFISMEIKDDNVTHLEIDFGYLYQKFLEEIEKEIKYYDNLLNSYVQNSLAEDSDEKSIPKFLLNPFKVYGKFFNPTADEIKEYNKRKENFKKVAQQLIKPIEINEHSKDELSEEDKKGWEEAKKELIEVQMRIKDANEKLVQHQKYIYQMRFEKILKERLSIDEFLSRFFKQVDEEDVTEWTNWLKSSDGLFNILDKESKFTVFGNLFLKEFIYENICNSLSSIKEKLNFNYISSIRNSPNRFYVKNKENSFGSILSDFLEKNPQTDDKVKKFLNKYLAYFEIGEQISIARNSDFGTYSITVYKQGKKINLLDLGYGISQIMPILLQILLTAFDGNTSSIIIEEPETNLHPALQSKLADMLIDANKVFGIQFIIETHSEYLIRKLQYLTAKGEIKPEDTQLYYFYHPDNIPDGESQVKKININNEGQISGEFGTGFFDEADKIAMSIWSMNQSQKN